MAFTLIQDAEDYKGWKITANNEGGGYGANVPVPFVVNRPAVAVAVGNLIDQHSAMTTRAIWAKVAVDNEGEPKAADPGGEASDRYFKIRLTPAGEDDSFTVTVPFPRLLNTNIDTVNTVGEALAAIYEADSGISKAEYIPNQYGR